MLVCREGDLLRIDRRYPSLRPAARNPRPPTPSAPRGGVHKLRSPHRWPARLRLANAHAAQVHRQTTRLRHPSAEAGAPRQTASRPVAPGRAHRSTTPAARWDTNKHLLTQEPSRRVAEPLRPHRAAADESKTMSQPIPAGDPYFRRCSRSSSTVIRSGHVPAWPASSRMRWRRLKSAIAITTASRAVFA